MDNGFITVPEIPGLGVELNEVVFNQQRIPGYFELTPEWNTDRLSNRLWS